MSLTARNRRCRRIAQVLALLAPPVFLIGCGSAPKPASPVPESTPRPAAPAKASPGIPALPPAGSGRGGYYMDDGPGDNPPEGLLDTPDPEPQVEPYAKRGNKPYVVFGKTYTPFTDDRPFKQRGIGSWYGRKFHGQKTSSGEPYDMYKMTAAHPLLPIPSYARVTNLSNGKQVIVRVNDRGPFHSGRIIDLSYTAALKLGYLGKGSSELEVERILPEEISRLSKRRAEQGENVAQPAQDIPAFAAAAPKSPRIEPAAAIVSAVNLGGPEAPRALEDLPAAVNSTASSNPVSAGGFYLQLGAFAKAENAEAARTRMAQHAAMALPPVEVVEQGQLYRLYSGPFTTRDDAAAAAQRLQEAGSVKPMVVQR